MANLIAAISQMLSLFSVTNCAHHISSKSSEHTATMLLREEKVARVGKTPTEGRQGLPRRLPSLHQPPIKLRLRRRVLSGPTGILQMLHSGAQSQLQLQYQLMMHR